MKLTWAMDGKTRMSTMIPMPPGESTANGGNIGQLCVHEVSEEPRAKEADLFCALCSMP